jgi:hypothetical protein
VEWLAARSASDTASGAEIGVEVGADEVAIIPADTDGRAAATPGVIALASSWIRDSLLKDALFCDAGSTCVPGPHPASVTPKNKIMTAAKLLLLRVAAGLRSNAQGKRMQADEEAKKPISRYL